MVLSYLFEVCTQLGDALLSLNTWRRAHGPPFRPCHVPTTMAADRSPDELMDDILTAQAVAEAEDPMMPVLQAAEAGDAKTLARLLDESAIAIDQAGEDGDTALHIACLYGHAAVVVECLHRGASVTACDEDNSTPLHDASAGGHTAVVQLLLSRGARADAIDNDGDSPLHLACNGGHAHVVRLLVEHMGAEQSQALVARANANGETPVDLAEDPALRSMVAAMRVGDAEEDADGTGSSYKRTKA